MPRKPTAIVQVNLRIREAERRKLEAAAKRNEVSMNAEIVARIARTFREAKAIEVDQLAENVARYLGPLVADSHELAKTGDLVRAADEVVALVQAGDSAGVAMNAAIARYGKVKRMIEIEAGIRLRAMHTTGAAS